MSEQAKVLIGGRWRDAAAGAWFAASNPATGEKLPGEFPVSAWPDVEEALDAAEGTFEQLEALPREKLAAFLDCYADKIDGAAAGLAEVAHAETALPVSPRLLDVEIPRTSGQLRKAADAARQGSWSLPTIDAPLNIRSVHEPIGPVAVFGPSNFPFAYNGVAGGDFAAAVAVGCPVLAKAHPLHPATTRRLAELAFGAVAETGLPAATVQLVYALSNDDGKRLVGDRRLGAAGFTGSRAAGLALKAAADAAGNPFYAEMSSVNPVVILPAALQRRGGEIADLFVQSCLLAVGQFCTNPGLVLLTDGDAAEGFVAKVAAAFEKATPGTLLSAGGLKSLAAGVAALVDEGAAVVTGGGAVDADDGRAVFANTLLRVDGRTFLSDPIALQREAFGNASLVVVCDDAAQIAQVVRQLEGNLTGGLWADAGDAEAYAKIEPLLRRRVGRLLNDKMPTGVAVSPAMQHGGPYPATSHGGFTAVGAPASLRRFTLLRAYDNVPQDRLPPLLRDENPGRRAWRLVDGDMTRDDVRAPSTPSTAR